VVAHLSHPHTRLHGTESFVADASGRLRTEEKTGTEQIAPLCMHGVPGHFYAVCAADAGGVGYVRWNTDEPKEIRLQLRADVTGSCDEAEMRHGPRAAPPAQQATTPP
jgi:hypothetical protein